MPAFYCIQMVFFSKVQFMNSVTHIQLIEVSLHLHLHKVVEISMATYVEVSWDLLYSK